jgi:hypothetical protein
MATQVALKISYNGDIHRARVDLRAFAFADLAQLMLSTFRLSPGAFVIQYVDPEGDRVNVASDADFAEACRVFLSGGGRADAAQTLKFVAVSRRQLEFQESVADPLVGSIETLIAALQATVDRVKRDGAGVAVDVQEAVADAARAVQDLPVDQVVRDTTDGVKAASTGFSSFASGLVGEIKRFIPDKKPAATQDAPAAPVVAEPEVVVPAPVAVAVAVAAPAPVEPTPVVAEVEAAPVAEQVEAVAQSAVAFSDAEVKWAEELSVVRNIVPDVDVARVIDMLEKSDGNINVVMNVLMEDN